MGALGNSGESRKYVNTFKGKFTIKGNDGDQGIVKRMNKNNKEVFELHFDTLSDVLIQGIEKRVSEEYGDDWKFLLAHTKSNELYSLTLPYSGRLTMGIFMRLPNLDVSKPITLKLYWFEKDEKAALVVYQGPNKVEVKWTKDNPGDLPELEQLTVNNKLTWDSTKRMAFIEQFLAKDIIPHLNKDFQPDESEQGSAVEGRTESAPAGGSKADLPTICWDGDLMSLKGMHEDGKMYACIEDGTFKKDENGELISAGDLPF